MVEIVPFRTLLMDFVREQGAQGGAAQGCARCRTFEYEFQLASMNRRLAPGDRDDLPHRRGAVRPTSPRAWCGKLPLWEAMCQSLVHPVVQRALRADLPLSAAAGHPL